LSVLFSVISISRLSGGRLVPRSAEFLLGEGCEEAQGFLYGEPLAAGEFEKYLRARQLGTKVIERRRSRRNGATRRQVRRA